jgi:Cu/Ag efflux protein CusF
MRLIWKLSMASAIAVTGLHLVQVPATAQLDTPSPRPVLPVQLAQPTLNQQLVGTWRLVKQGNQSVLGTPSAQRLRFYTGTQWNITQADAQTKRVIFHHGGTYSLNNQTGRMVSTVNYAIESGASRLNTVSNFQITVQGDTYTQVGLDNPFTETWERVK